MTNIHKLKVLQEVANDVVNRNAELESREYGVNEVAMAIKSLKIVLAAIGARPEDSKPPPEPS